MGGSYGGYATLAGLTFTPDDFACGVDIVGPSNLRHCSTDPAVLGADPQAVPSAWATRDRGRPRAAEERSPLTHADKIKRPLLIGQGANDPRVKQAESDQIVEAMRRRASR
jgi:dipeptidyl aminopeptidase/acylaminoacyl peptidase